MSQLVPCTKRTSKEIRRKIGNGNVICCLGNSQYKLWIPSRNVAITSRDMTIAEGTFPGKDLIECGDESATFLFEEVQNDKNARKSPFDSISAPIPPRGVPKSQVNATKGKRLSNFKHLRINLQR